MPEYIANYSNNGKLLILLVIKIIKETWMQKIMFTNLRC